MLHLNQEIQLAKLARRSPATSAPTASTHYSLLTTSLVLDKCGERDLGSIGGRAAAADTTQIPGNLGLHQQMHTNLVTTTANATGTSKEVEQATASYPNDFKH